jgi:hypothetical protein
VRHTFYPPPGKLEALETDRGALERHYARMAPKALNSLTLSNVTTPFVRRNASSAIPSSSVIF